MSYDAAAFAAELAGIFTPGAILPWAVLLVIIMAPILVISFGLAIGKMLVRELRGAFK
jgi:hypothetical protein